MKFKTANEVWKFLAEDLSKPKEERIFKNYTGLCMKIAYMCDHFMINEDLFDYMYDQLQSNKINAPSPLNYYWFSNDEQRIEFINKYLITEDK